MFHQLQKSLSHLPIGLLWINDQGVIVHAHQEADAYVNKSGIVPESGTLFNLAPHLSLKTWKKIWAQLLETKACRLDTEFISSDKAPVPVCLHFTIIEIQKEKLALAYVENKQAQRAKELEDARQAVEDLSKRLKEENLTLREELSQTYNFNNIITRSEKYKKVLTQVGQVADTDATVLLIGETGTGKELLARAIYTLSDREQAPLIKVDCAALPRSLIESELFGHEKGAFTGAAQLRKGRFEIAHKGTIFLDEIGEMPLSLQPKLLRVLQDGEFERVGGTKTIKVDVRVVAATNRNLKEMVDNGKFREDLYYRLNVFPIYNIPLRERPEDIPILIRHFVKKYCQKTGKTIEKIAQADINQLLKYDFPGNVRELENLIERAVILTRGDKLNLRDSFYHIKKDNKPLDNTILSFEDMQRQHIIKTLEQTKWRITGPKGAARLLGLKDRTLMSKMRKLGIRWDDYA